MKKSVLNAHIAIDEHAFLREQAKRLSMTVTMYVRLIIRDRMERERADDRSKVSGRRW